MEKIYYKTMKIYRGIVLFLCLFIGIGAMAGGICMLIKPDGSILHMENLLSYFEKLPFSKVLFRNYIFSGISLIIVNGITNLIAVVFLLKDKKAGYLLSFIFGITLMLWICIQFWLFAPSIAFLDVLYFLLGLFQFIFGFAAYVNDKQLHFHFDEKDYTNISRESKENIVIYFSRMGYTKKLAYEKANELKGSLVEIVPTEKVKGILGFWWCGRFGMHQWRMNTKNIEVNLKEYKNIYIFSPIWVFHLAAPMRDFIEKYKSEIHNVHFTLTHYQPISYKKEIARIQKLSGIKFLENTTVCIQKANVKFIKEIG